MAPDSEQKKKYDSDFKKENSGQITVRFFYSTGVLQALDKCISDKEISKRSYIANALCNQLIRDGYNPEDYKPKPEK